MFLPDHITFAQSEVKGSWVFMRQCSLDGRGVGIAGDARRRPLDPFAWLLELLGQFIVSMRF
jgi:hypothetical protein